jgi:hypothetical protein
MTNRWSRGALPCANKSHGDLFTAFDLADRGVAELPDDPSLRHHAVLASRGRARWWKLRPLRRARRPTRDQIAGSARLTVEGALSRQELANTELAAG